MNEVEELELKKLHTSVFYNWEGDLFFNCLEDKFNFQIHFVSPL